MNRHLLCLASLSGCLLVGGLATAQTVLVDEDFESYADSNALFNVWSGANNAQATLVDETYETIIDDTFENVAIGARAYDSPNQGVEHLGASVLQYQPTLNGGVPLLPTETQSIVLQGDIFDVGNFGNKRMSIGLRSASDPVENIIELGHYNSDLVELAYRGILFPSVTGDDANPNWQFHDFDIALDRADDADDIVTLADFGEAWHTHRAIVTPDTVTYEIDLYRDGLNNATGEAGIDSSTTWNITTSPAGYSDLRIGGPSGITSGGNGLYGGVFFDNISLSLTEVDAPPATGDYNQDGIVDAADYTVWRDALGQNADPVGSGADGNENGVIDNGDYDEWANNYGATGTPGATTIPEPTSLLMVALLGLGLASKRR